MKERFLYAKFAKKLRDHMEPGSFFWHKLPDTGGTGGNRPFDGFLVYEGVPWGIEFKAAKGKLTEYQKFHLDLMVRAGGRRLVIYADDNMDEIIQEVIMKERSNYAN